MITRVMWDSTKGMDDCWFALEVWCGWVWGGEGGEGWLVVAGGGREWSGGGSGGGGGGGMNTNDNWDGQKNYKLQHG